MELLNEVKSIINSNSNINYNQYKDLTKLKTYSIDDKEINSIYGDTIKVGWSKVSLIPNFLSPMAGYGARKGANYEGVNDSIWVKAVVFDNGINRSAYVSLDLLIVPPNLDYNKISEGINIESENILFTASHTHSSIGGYLEGIAGEIFGGKFDKRNLDFITEKTREAIISAHESISKAKIGYAPIFASDFITNRLIGDSLGTYDPYIRLIKSLYQASVMLI